MLDVEGSHIDCGWGLLCSQDTTANKNEGIFSSAWIVFRIVMMRARTDVKRLVLLEERSRAQTLPLAVRRRNAVRSNTRGMLSLNAIWDGDVTLHLASKVVTLLGIERLY